MTDYQIILLFAFGGVAGVGLPLLLGKLIRPNHPNPQKNSTYESGEQSVGSAWGKFNIRFYVIALIFVLFETELVFLFPWAIVFGNEAMIAETNGLWGIFAFTEMAIFIIILALGLAYVWAKGFLEWEKPAQRATDYKSVVPEDMYKKINEKYK